MQYTTYTSYGDYRPVSTHLRGNTFHQSQDDALAELLQLSLVNQERDRFSLLPLTRSLVLEDLAQEPEREQTLRDRWIGSFTTLARPYADLHLHWHDLPMIRQEGVHYLTQASWCQQAGRPDVLLKILPALGFYYDLTGQWADLLSTGRLALEYAKLTGDLESIVFIETHILCHVLCDQGHSQEAERFIVDALNMVQQIDNPSRACEVLVNYARVFRRREQFEQALAYTQHALQLVAQLTGTQRIHMQAYTDYETRWGNSLEIVGIGRLPSSICMPRGMSFSLTQMILSLISSWPGGS